MNLASRCPLPNSDFLKTTVWPTYRSLGTTAHLGIWQTFLSGGDNSIVAATSCSYYPDIVDHFASRCQRNDLLEEAAWCILKDELKQLVDTSTNLAVD